MKKLLTITCLCALAGAGIAFASVKPETKSPINGIEKCECGFRCSSCKGTGFSNGNGNTTCFFCKGTGRNNSY